MSLRQRLMLAALTLALGACNHPETPAALPPPWEITADSVSHFCGMGLNEHDGPKGQIFVANRKTPYWFASVRETIAFTKMPEEPRDIAAIYVNDMGKARNWARPESGTWIDATKAWYVIGSRRSGGMNESEAVPFGDRAKAKAFADSAGGRIVRYDQIPDDYVFLGNDFSSASSDSTKPKE